MSLLSCTDLCLAFGHLPLLDHAAFALEPGERVGLIGRNGSGKSSLLRIIAGLQQPDDGRVVLQQGLRQVYVAQEAEFAAGASVFDGVAEGVAEARALCERFAEQPPDEDLDALLARIELLDGWNWQQRVAQVLERLGLDGGARIDELSGCMRKRVALGRALVADPDLLLLDEPTNHLDLDAIIWLESLLQGFRGTVVLVTHDRAFLDAVVTRIVELDRGALRSYPGNFAAFEARRAQALADEAAAAARADKLLALEEAWIRKGVEARRTRSVGRVQRLQRLRAARAARRETLGRVRLELDAAAAGGRIVADLDDVHLALGGRQLLRGVSTTILRGDKVGVVGPNGAGKTSLLKLILGEIEPDAGRVRRGTRLQVAYFDQMRAALDPQATLAQTISPGGDWIEIGGARKHVIGYLGDFLFSPQRALSPVGSLSGGERNRLLLARLFARPANLLVLDEPTNDLDVETLELLEQLLQEFDGTVFLVSHDRRFLDHVVTSTLVAEGAGCWREYEGGVDDWLAQAQRRREVAAAATSAPPAAAPRAAQPRQPQPARKLSYKEQRELEQLPQRIVELEAEQARIGERLSDAALYRDEPHQIAPLQARLQEIDDALLDLLERWEALEQR